MGLLTDNPVPVPGFFEKDQWGYHPAAARITRGFLNAPGLSETRRRAGINAVTRMARWGDDQKIDLCALTRDHIAAYHEARMTTAGLPESVIDREMSALCGLFDQLVAGHVIKRPNPVAAFWLKPRAPLVSQIPADDTVLREPRQPAHPLDVLRDFGPGGTR